MNPDNDDSIIIVMPEPDEFTLSAEPMEFIIPSENDEIFIPEAR